MTKFANLEQQARTEMFAERGTHADLDFWAGRKYRGEKVRALKDANLVKRGVISTRNVLKVRNVMNQGFNGQVVIVETSTGRILQLPLSAVSATR
jgi:hypothetical protein